MEFLSKYTRISGRLHRCEQGARRPQRARAQVVPYHSHLCDEAQPVCAAGVYVGGTFVGFNCRNVWGLFLIILQESLSRLPWCRVMSRHEEMSNSIIFYINSWENFALPGGRPKPDMGTVTVSRRGIFLRNVACIILSLPLTHSFKIRCGKRQVRLAWRSRLGEQRRVAGACGFHSRCVAGVVLIHC